MRNWPAQIHVGKINHAMARALTARGFRTIGEYLFTDRHNRDSAWSWHGKAICEETGKAVDIGSPTKMTDLLRNDFVVVMVNRKTAECRLVSEGS